MAGTFATLARQHCSVRTWGVTHRGYEFIDGQLLRVGQELAPMQGPTAGVLCRTAFAE